MSEPILNDAQSLLEAGRERVYTPEAAALVEGHPARKQYVLCFAHQVPFHSMQDVVLIERKNEPHAGKLNLPGGKIYGGEPIEKAAARELQEETGLVASLPDIKVLGTIEGDTWQVHVCFCPYRSTHMGGRSQEARTVSNEGQTLVLKVKEAMDDPLLIPNLKVIIPLCIARLSGWQIRDLEDGVVVRLTQTAVAWSNAA